MKPKYMEEKTFQMANPLETAVKGLQSAFSQITGKLAGENYDDVAKSFAPANSALLKPKYPIKSGIAHFFDLDGDSNNELVASYKLDDEVGTMILKKRKDSWSKIAEISHPHHDGINFRGVADLTGSGKKNLLLGLTFKGSSPILYAYSLEKDRVEKLFARKYSRINILRQPGQRSASAKTKLAFWDKTDSGDYNIEVSRWNGSQLEVQNDPRTYYYDMVIPYYARRVKGMPYSVPDWFGLAEALKKIEAYRDALVAVQMGMQADIKAKYKERFIALRDSIKSLQG